MACNDVDWLYLFEQFQRRFTGFELNTNACFVTQKQVSFSYCPGFTSHPYCYVQVDAYHKLTSSTHPSPILP